ncbi:actin depolymerization factor/cofilin-like domain-containing protein [Streptomyces sp. APSN-46.1]|uniref:actin-binding ADF family protein n=1 Tax=Streptomyces sp. APSN-46.1 TaxID=2929049 RepID=UPI001FB48566|nr:actin depolymerization factor/cofilin-like domain-containing protein [Streptomyces sp. APSN-46.1]MCJ1675988.1 actin depolymerization factor/cofilin-like domain-containing protein [Streptomyces sp. APSN-46.1]
MSSRGTTVDDSCLSAFQELRSKREINTVIYRLNEPLDTVVVESEANLTHEEMLESLPANEPRFVAYALCFATADGARRSDLVMIFWIPDGALPAHKLAYSSAYGVLRDLFDGIQVDVRATTLSDLAYNELVSQAV